MGLIGDSLLGEKATEPDDTESADAAVASIRKLVEQDPSIDQDWNELARDHGLSPTHFRRCWQRQLGIPPGRYRTQLCLRMACRLLTDDPAPISDIAEKVGFTDRLYFARCFKKFTGMTARSGLITVSLSGADIFSSG